MRIGFRGTIGALAAVGLLVGCRGMTTAADPPPLDGTAWVLTELPGRTLVPESTVTLQFADGRLSGSDGCNRYTGGYRSKRGAIDVPEQLASTQMACAPELMAQGRAYLDALVAARSYRVDGDRLELRSASGSALAKFAAQPQTLAGTSWRATGINNGRQAVSSVVGASNVTMSFGADGRVGGSAGCNSYSAGFTAEGAKLSIGEAAVTRRACADPAVMQQEQNFLAALGTVATSRVEGERLELRTATGALAVSLVRDGAGEGRAERP